jgi:ATP-dependent RNA helicase DDX56/DBP9
MTGARGHNHWGRTGTASASNVSRGVDFKDVGTVVLFDFPRSVKSYIHRVGRTARADRAGVSLAFVANGDEADSLALQAVLDTQVERQVRAGVPLEHAQASLQALPLDRQSVEAFRYRASDKLCAVTGAAVREERLAQIKAELVNSARLKAHWEDNPRELQLLQHDHVLRGQKVSKHLASVPSYLLPEGMQESAAAAAPQASNDSSDANRNKLRRNKHKLAVGASNAARKNAPNLARLSGISLAKAKGRQTMAAKAASDPLRSFRARSLGGGGSGTAFGANVTASGGASKPKVDF